MIKLNPAMFAKASSIRPCSIQLSYNRTYTILWDPIGTALRDFRLAGYLEMEFL